MADEPLHHVLPRAYSLALRLRAIGADEQLIGECLEVEPSSVSVLLELAEAKLQAAERAHDRLP